MAPAVYTLAFRALTGTQDRRTARGRRAPRRAIRAAVAVSTGGALAAAAVLAVVVLAPGSHTTADAGYASPAGPVASTPAGTRPLIRLADYVRAEAQPAGDATLVLRTQTYADGGTVTGADLYTDSGKYFYSATQSGLPAEIAAGDHQGDGFMQRDIDAALFATNGDIATARERMANAALDPSINPNSPATITAAQEAAAKRLHESLSTFRQSLPKADPQASMDNAIWENSPDALIGGAGNPQVRAGVLRLLAMIPEVTVAQTTTGGQPTLTLTAGPPAFPSGYHEHLTINANTGMPIQFVGGTSGQAPDVTVTYTVSRVTAANIAAGS
jgi:hypothetical protein